MAHSDSLKNLKPRWKPGQSGNPAGRPPGKTWKQVLSELGEAKKEELREVAYQMALQGSVPALDWLVKHSGESGAGGGTQVNIGTTAFTIKIGVPGEEDELETGEDDVVVEEPLMLPTPATAHDPAIVTVIAPDPESAEADEEEALTEALSILADEPATALPASIQELVAGPASSDPDVVYRLAQQAASDAYIKACEGADRKTALAADVIYQAALQRANNAHNRALMKAARDARAQATKDVADPPSKQDKYLDRHGWV